MGAMGRHGNHDKSHNSHRTHNSHSVVCGQVHPEAASHALRTAGRPIGVATYTVVPELPETYRDQLPSPEQIAERLRLWDEQEGGEI